ncbi:unnamed protein product [Protopolystoma xenopodis]|uniref:Uncharacterized protein n=1 Tax=Protopolystoma xenopodis TaxID=117903 RepID=A0A3S5AX52_9PLAT|nr:unnamed protein product [Protopolystoma xenopodis]
MGTGPKKSKRASSGQAGPSRPVHTSPGVIRSVGPLDTSGSFEPGPPRRRTPLQSVPFELPHRAATSLTPEGQMSLVMTTDSPRRPRGVSAGALHPGGVDETAYSEREIIEMVPSGSAGAGRRSRGDSQGYAAAPEVGLKAVVCVPSP